MVNKNKGNDFWIFTLIFYDLKQILIMRIELIMNTGCLLDY